MRYSEERSGWTPYPMFWVCIALNAHQLPPSFSARSNTAQGISEQTNWSWFAVAKHPHSWDLREKSSPAVGRTSLSYTVQQSAGISALTWCCQFSHKMLLASVDVNRHTHCHEHLGKERENQHVYLNLHYRLSWSGSSRRRPQCRTHWLLCTPRFAAFVENKGRWGTWSAYAITLHLLPSTFTFLQRSFGRVH